MSVRRRRQNAGKVEEEKERCRDFERLSEEYEVVASECRRLQQQILSRNDSSDRRYQRKWEEAEAGLTRERRIRLEEASRRDGRRDARIDELRDEVDRLRDERTSREEELRAREDEGVALARRADEGEEELGRATEDLERSDARNDEYSARIEDYEGKLESLAEEANEFKASRVKFR